jgi:hypothetical protein
MLSLSPDGRQLVTGGFAQPTRWWDLRTGTNSVLQAEPRRVVFSPDNETLAIFARDQPVELWDIRSRKLRLILEDTAGFGHAAAFSSDGKLLAVSTGFMDVDDAIELYSAQTGGLLGSCRGHKQPVFSLAFSPDGKTLASASDDSTLRLWNVSTHQELLSLRRLGGALSGLTFSPDGCLLAGLSGFFSDQPQLRIHRAASLRDIDGVAPVTSDPR